MARPAVVILTAVRPETRAVRRHVGPPTPVYTIGVGGSRLAAVPPPAVESIVLMVGVGGALDPMMAVGDVVLDDPTGLVPAVHVRRGAIHTATNIVVTPAEKASLFATTGAVVVDMEQAAVRAWAATHGARVVGLRAVSDSAADTLDPVVLRLVTDVGRPRPLAIAVELCRRPSLVPYLRRLSSNTTVALDRLGPAVRAVIDALATDAARG